MKIPQIQRLLQRTPVCENCGEVCGDTVFRFAHEHEGYVESEVTFCSAECWQEYLNVVPAEEVDRRYRKEANFLYGLVCPACKNRFRKKVAEGVLDEP